jgi:hypothetical protein
LAVTISAAASSGPRAATALALCTLKEYGATGSNKALLQADPAKPSARSISGVKITKA